MVYFLYVVLVVGALGLFLAVPGARPSLARLGLLTLAAAGAGLLGLVGRFYTPDANLTVLYLCSAVALFAAVRVITHKRPVYSALYFVLLVVAVGGLLVLMQAEFLAAALLIVYAGAILVTYIFVIMLAQQARGAPYDTRAREPFWGLLGGFVLLGAITAHLVTGAPPGNLPVPADLPTPLLTAGTIQNVGTPLLTQYIIAIQLAGLLLLAAMVGAIAVARRPTVAEEFEEEA